MYLSEWSGEFRVYDAERVKIYLELKERKLTWIEKRGKKKKKSPATNQAGRTDTDEGSCNVNRKHYFCQGHAAVRNYNNATCSFHFLLGIPNCSVFLTPSLADNTQFLVNSLFLKSYCRTTTSGKLTPASLRPSSESISKSPVHKDAYFHPPA